MRLSRLSSPLTFIFWGALLTLFDFHVGLRLGDHQTTISLTASLGLGLIALGTAMLGFGGYFEGSADLILAAVGTFYIAAFALQVASWFVSSLQDPGPIAALAFHLIGTVCIVALCSILRTFSLDLGLFSDARRWAVAAGLCLFFWPLPPVVLAYSPRFLGTPAYGLFATLCRLIPAIAFLLSTYALKSKGTGVSPPRRSLRNV